MLVAAWLPSLPACRDSSRSRAQGGPLLVPSQFPSIQAAIDNARTGSTIIVSPGTYNENLDLGGRDLVLRSSHGAAVTTIDGRALGPVITVGPGQGNQTIIEGFTLTDGAGLFVGSEMRGGGICCNAASPTIRNNVLLDNRAGFGGGLYCRDGSPLVENNVFIGNRGSSTWRGTYGGGLCAVNGKPVIRLNRFERNSTGHGVHAGGMGGAIYCDGGAVIESNSILDNSVTAYSSSGIGGGIACGEGVIIANNIVAANHAGGVFLTSGRGGGIACGINCAITNNTLVDNTAGQGEASAIQADGGTTISNCIVRSPVVSATYPLIKGAPIVTYSNLTGGWPGTGNIDADPSFVDASAGDFHLCHDSPCRDAGTNIVSGLPATDFEGDPRVAGAAVDMGMDEFYPHLYSRGDSSPGGTLRIRMIGNPSDPALWAVSFNPSVLNPPLSIPGLTGKLYLMFPMVFVPVGNFPSKGVLAFSVKFPTNSPVPSDYPMQVLSGLYLSNLHVVNVR
jgi:hypothetical protein